MAAEAFKACPACDARNRVHWEFCVRCGEALHDVAASAAEPEGVSLGPVTVSPVAAAASFIGILFVVALGGYAAGRLWPVEPPQGPDPSHFPPLARPSPLPPGFATSAPAGDVEKREGRRLLLGGDSEAALTALRRAVAAAPEDATIRNLYAHALWQQGDLQAAVAEFRNATRLGGERTLRLQADLANALAAAGQNVDAILEYEKLAAENPGSSATYRELGQLYLEEGRAREAVDALSEASRLAPKNPDLQEQLGFVLEQAGRPEEAVAAYRKATELAPQDGAKVIRLAEVVSREDPEQGIEVLREATERIPDQPLLQQRLGIALEKAGRTEEALAAYREYLRQAPGAPDAQRVADRAEYLEQEGGGGGGG